MRVQIRFLVQVRFPAQVQAVQSMREACLEVLSSPAGRAGA